MDDSRNKPSYVAPAVIPLGNVSVTLGARCSNGQSATCSFASCGNGASKFGGSSWCHVGTGDSDGCCTGVNTAPYCCVGNGGGN
jgi:hypothetical protein